MTWNGMPLSRRFHRIPATMRLLSSVRASFSISDAIMTMSESGRCDAVISSLMSAVFMSKFARMTATIAAASADGEKKYVSGNKYPSYCFATVRNSSADIPGRAAATCFAVSRTVVPSSKVMRVSGNP